MFKFLTKDFRTQGFWMITLSLSFSLRNIFRLSEAFWIALSALDWSVCKLNIVTCLRPPVAAHPAACLLIDHYIFINVITFLGFEDLHLRMLNFKVEKVYALSGFKFFSLMMNRNEWLLPRGCTCFIIDKSSIDIAELNRSKLLRSFIDSNFIVDWNKTKFGSFSTLINFTSDMLMSCKKKLSCISRYGVRRSPLKSRK